MSFPLPRTPPRLISIPLDPARSGRLADRANWSPVFAVSRLADGLCRSTEQPDGAKPRHRGWCRCTALQCRASRSAARSILAGTAGAAAAPDTQREFHNRAPFWATAGVVEQLNRLHGRHGAAACRRRHLLRVHRLVMSRVTSPRMIHEYINASETFGGHRLRVSSALSAQPSSCFHSGSLGALC